MSDPYPSSAVSSSPAEKPESEPTSLKVILWKGAYDFRNVFLYPLCAGIMTGLGFAVGKRMGEIYFYGRSSRSS